MKTIFTYPLQGNFNGKASRIELPIGAQVLSFKIQRDVPCIWALVDPDVQEMTIHEFVIYGTGAPIDDYEYLEFIGSDLSVSGVFVFHCFERRRS